MRLLLAAVLCGITTASAELPVGFVYLDEAAPGILIEIRYAQEWWHFTLEGEPFPETYFDFPVE